MTITFLAGKKWTITRKLIFKCPPRETSYSITKKCGAFWTTVLIILSFKYKDSTCAHWNWYAKMSTFSLVTFFVLNFCRTQVLYVAPLIPLLLVTSALGFNARDRQGGFLPCMLSCLRAVPQIHLWCDTCWLVTVLSFREKSVATTVVFQIPLLYLNYINNMTDTPPHIPELY